MNAEDLVARYLDDRRFVPRPWLAELVRTQLDDPECRIVLLTAEPGFGKTAFMAWLTTQLSTEPASSPLRYFIRSDSIRAFRTPYAKDFLLAIGHQLAWRRPELFLHEPMVSQRIGDVGRDATVVGMKDVTVVLSPFVESAVLVAQELGKVKGEVIGILRGVVYADPPVDDLFRLAIGAPAELLARTDPAARIVILLDGADEARWATGSATVLEWLANDSPELAPNVRLVIASRPDEERFRRVQRRHEPHVRVLQVDRAGEEIRRDLNAYAQKFIEEPAVTGALTSRAIPLPMFAGQVVGKADGNFQYLAALFRAIEEGLRHEDGPRAGSLEGMLRLEGIPQGLNELYAYFIDRVKQRTEADVGEGWFAAWEAALRVLGVLAVAREPLSREQIGLFSSVGHTWLSLSLGLLAQFLEQRESRYQLYHASLPDFLVSQRTRQEHPDQWLDAAEWHFVVGARAVEANDGRWSGATDRYVLAQTTGHLRLALTLRHRFGSVDGAEALSLIHRLGRDHSFLQAQAAAFSENPELPLATLQVAVEASAEASEAASTAEFLLRRALLRDAVAGQSPLGALYEPGGLTRALELAEMFPGPTAGLWGLLIAWALFDASRHEEAAEVLDRLARAAAVPVFGIGEFTDAAWLLASLAPLTGGSFVTLAQRLLDGQGLAELIGELIFVGAFDAAHRLCVSGGEEQLAGTDYLGGWSRWREGACFTLGEALLEEKRWAEARNVFELAVSCAKDEFERGRSQGRVAAAWAAASRAKEAVEAFRLAQAAGSWFMGTLAAQVAEAQAWAGDLSGALDTVKLADEAAEVITGLIGLAEVQLERRDRESAEGLLADAESLARGIRESRFGVSVPAVLAGLLAELAEVQQRSGNAQKAAELARDARQATATLSTAWERGMTVARVEATLGDMEAAVAATAVDRDQHTRDRTVHGLYALRSYTVRRPVNLAIRAGDLDRATRLAQQIDPQFRAQAIADLCRQHCRRGETATAFALCLRLADARLRLELLLRIIRCAHQANDTGTVEAALEEAARLRPDPNQYWIKPEPQTALARAYGYAGNGEVARALFARTLLTETDGPDSSQDARSATAMLIAKIGEAEGKAGRKANAEALIADAERWMATLDGFPASTAVVEIVRAHVSCGQFSMAAKTADHIHGTERVDTLLSAARMLQEAGKTSLAQRLRQSAARAVPALPERYDRHRASESLAFFDASRGDKKAVLRAVTEMATHSWDHPFAITHILGSLACRIAQDGNLDGALTVIDSAPTPTPPPVFNGLYDRPAFVAEMAVELLAEGLVGDGQLQQAEKLARTRLRKGGIRDSVLVKLADELAAHNEAASALGLAKLAEAGSARAQILAAGALAQARGGENERSKVLFQQAIAAAREQQSFHDQGRDQALVKISILQARAGASSEARATIALLEEATSPEQRYNWLVLDALIGVGVELGAFDRTASAAAFDRAVELCSSTHELKRVGVGEAQAGLPDRAVQRAMTIFRAPPTEEPLRPAAVFATGSMMEIPDILDELQDRHYVTAVMQVVPLCSRTVGDALRGSLALSLLYPDQAFEVANAVSSIIE